MGREGRGRLTCSVAHPTTEHQLRSDELGFFRFVRRRVRPQDRLAGTVDRCRSVAHGRSV